MVKVQAVIPSSRAEAVVERLSMIGAHEIYVSEVRGFGRTRGRGLVSKGSPYEVEFVPKILIEWCGSEHDADGVVRAIEHAARTGQLGDGRVFVSPLDFGYDPASGELCDEP